MAKTPKPNFAGILDDVRPAAAPALDAVATQEQVQINVKLDANVKKALDLLVALRKVDGGENASQREIIQQALLAVFSSDEHAARLEAVLSKR